MVTPNPAPNDGRPSDIEEGKGASTAGPATNQQAVEQAAQADDHEPRTTQSQLANNDGAGIRGDYGDASQTNGLEGGASEATDATPDRAGHNPTNAAQDNADVV